MSSQTTEVQLGAFHLQLDSSKQTFQIVHENRPNEAIFASSSQSPFVQIGFGKDDFGEGYGTFNIIDNDQDLSHSCVLTSLAKKGSSSAVLSLSLKYDSSQSSANLADREACITFSPSNESANGQLLFQISVKPVKTDVPSKKVKGHSESDTTLYENKSDNWDDHSESNMKVFLNLHRRLDERLYGFGEQFSQDAVKGFSSGRIPMMTREDGVGRGLQPISFLTNNVFGKHAAGGPTYAYKPVPFYFTNGTLNGSDSGIVGQSLLIENTDYSLVDLTKRERIQLKVVSSDVHGRILYGETPREIVKEVTLFTGRMKPLPDWVMDGVIGGIQGGEQKVLDIVLAAKQYNVPLVGVWLQDWCGKRIQKVFGGALKRLWWNWESDDVIYPNWNKFVTKLEKEHNVSVLSYVNSFLADVELGKKKGYRRNLYQEARDSGYLVLEKGDVPLAISSGPNFQAGLVDLFNPEAYEWLKDILKDALATGAKGYMADFAEFLPPGMLTHKGVASSGDHNAYAVQWAKLQSEVLQELGNESDILIFHRSGFTQSPGVARCFWTGDQLVSWDTYDGMAAGLAGLLSSGLCGFSLNHTDMGGYTTFAFSFWKFKLGYYRTQELLLRWMEFCAFQPVFRSHEGSMPDVNAQFYDNDTTWSHLRLCGLLFKSLKAYRKSLMKESFEKGYPLVRHMLLEYPRDPICWQLSDQFMLGDTLLVRPVLKSGQNQVQVYIPSGPWMHIWSKKVYIGPSTVSVSAPLGKPCILVKSDAVNDSRLSSFFQTVESLL